MKINTRQLRRIIQEEIGRLHEMEGDDLVTYVDKNLQGRLKATMYGADGVAGGYEAVRDLLHAYVDAAYADATVPTGPDRVFRGGRLVTSEGRRRR